jgi:hypothetical protein
LFGIFRSLLVASPLLLDFFQQLQLGILYRSDDTIWVPRLLTRYFHQIEVPAIRRHSQQLLLLLWIWE